MLVKIKSAYKKWLHMSDKEKNNLFKQLKDNGLLLINTNGDIEIVKLETKVKNTYYPVILANYRVKNIDDFLNIVNNNFNFVIKALQMLPEANYDK